MFQPGDRISILNEKGELIILQSNNTYSLVVDEHGFERRVNNSLLCLRKHQTTSELTLKEEDKSTNSSNKKPQKTHRIDLHLDSLPPRNWTNNHDKLLYQLHCFKEFCNDMFRMKVKSFEVIHGHGKGVLHRELKFLVENTIGLAMHDNQLSFGRIGSSMVEISFSKFNAFII